MHAEPQLSAAGSVEDSLAALTASTPLSRRAHPAMRKSTAQICELPCSRKKRVASATALPPQRRGSAARPPARDPRVPACPVAAMQRYGAL
jgi:hypothetical protein